MLHTITKIVKAMNTAAESLEMKRGVTTKGIKKMSSLVFGVDVLKGDHLRYQPESEGLRKIIDENDLAKIQANHPDVIVIINRNAEWMNQFRIPAWDKSQSEYDTLKAQTLNNWNTTE